MKLKDLLSKYTMAKLADICRTLEISGFSTLKQQALFELVYENIKVKQSIKQWLDSLSDIAIKVLATIAEFGKQTAATALKSKCATYFPNARISQHLMKLQSMGLIFIVEDGDDDLIYIADEFFPWYQEYFTENQILIQDDQPDFESGDLSEKSQSLFKTLDSLLFSSLVSIDIIRLFLEEHSAPIDGSKNALISRLLYEVQMKPEEILERVFMKEDLRDIASDLGLTKGGNRSELINKILSVLPKKYSVPEYLEQKAKNQTETEEGDKQLVAIPTIFQFFMSDEVDAKKIRNLLDSHGMESMGPRKKIVRSLLEESGIPVIDIFDALFNGDTLKDLCGKYGLKKGGNKSELMQRIIEVLPSGNLKINSQSVASKKVKGLASITTDIPHSQPKRRNISQEGDTLTEKPQTKSVKGLSKAQKVYDEILQDLNQVFRPDDYPETRNFNIYIRQHLTRSNFNVKTEDTQEITTVDGNQILIFCAVIPKTKSGGPMIEKAMSKFATIQIKYIERIAFIWDPKKAMDEDQKDAFQTYTNGLFWYRSNDDFPEVL